MNVFHFGDADRPLFGAHHEPAPAADLGRAVVLCSPVSQEYMRTHWCLRRLADRLAKSGVHVMRFDYSGQGDSWGGDDDASVATWVANVVEAVDEIRDASGAAKISLVGLRFGAVLASLATAKCEGIEHLILWDAVAGGAAYVGEMRDLHARKLDRWKFSHDESEIPAGAEELIARTWPQGFIAEVESLTFPDVRPKAKTIHVFASAERDGEASIGQGWGEPAVTRRVIPTAGDWDVVDEMDEALLAGPIENAIVEILTEKA